MLTALDEWIVVLLHLSLNVILNIFQYMVYMLKFDIAHSYTIYHKKEMNVRESPTGQVQCHTVLRFILENIIRSIFWALQFRERALTIFIIFPSVDCQRSGHSRFRRAWRGQNSVGTCRRQLCRRGFRGSGWRCWRKIAFENDAGKASNTIDLKEIFGGAVKTNQCCIKNFNFLMQHFSVAMLWFEYDIMVLILLGNFFN